MKEVTSYNRAVQYLNKIFKHINTEFFNDSLEMPTITVQSTAEAYGHVTVGKVWKKRTWKFKPRIKCISRLPGQTS